MGKYKFAFVFLFILFGFFKTKKLPFIDEKYTTIKCPNILIKIKPKKIIYKTDKKVCPKRVK